ncbi:MAG: hypothetical protein OEW72_10100, partial [Gammaproteobacteria bacterium]|nr:hypothetical protein [Gammaproteobacteria bacterium]
MLHIGLLCNCRPDGNPAAELSPSVVNRAVLLARLLAPSGVGVFLFSPRDVVTPEEVPGFVVRGDEFVPARMPVPRINASWTYGTRRLLNEGMGYRTFQRWIREHGIQVYVPYAFAEMVSNKRKACTAVSAFDPGLHPRTEDYSGRPAQLEEFMRPTGIAFVKPRAGNKGNRIFVARRDATGLSLTYYEKKDRQHFGGITLDAAVAVIGGAMGGMSYVVQEGVDTLRINGSVFDIRVVAVNDGRLWHTILETRLSPPGSDLSNIAQGGTIHVTEELLAASLGSAATRELLERVDATALGLARHLEASFPGELMELG